MSPLDVLRESARRRTFAIISHPDAGKTTLTEKLLLYGGAIEQAGAVKARKGRRTATSDWMELEKTRGISITSTVLRFDYEDAVVNLLDTPGHRDFSEDTYRVLTAVDAAVMVLDGAKGIEPQTLKLFEVCRARRVPLLTFINKLDRPGLDPLALLDQIEERIGLRPTPITWPVGDPGDFRGVVDRRSGAFIRFTRTARGAHRAPEEVVDPSDAADDERDPLRQGLENCALLDEIGADLDLESFLAGESTPVFVGSALTNFGVRHLLDALVEFAPPPTPARAADETRRPVDAPFSGFVFKVQANMDPRHRDRLAFVRVCSGRFERGMTVTCSRTGRPFGTNYAATTVGEDRATIDKAFPGDVVGLINASDLRLGDTLYTDEPVTYPPIPSFAPEHFASVRSRDVTRTKQLQKGISQLDEEGVIQLLHDPEGQDPVPLVGAVGPLQLEVMSHRLDHEFGAPPLVTPSAYRLARRTDPASHEALRGAYGVRVVARTDGTLLALFETPTRLRRVQDDHPDLHLEPIVAA